METRISWCNTCSRYVDDQQTWYRYGNKDFLMQYMFTLYFLNPCAVGFCVNKIYPQTRFLFFPWHSETFKRIRERCRLFRLRWTAWFAFQVWIWYILRSFITAGESHRFLHTNASNKNDSPDNSIVEEHSARQFPLWPQSPYGKCGSYRPRRLFLRPKCSELFVLWCQWFLFLDPRLIDWCSMCAELCQRRQSTKINNDQQ